MSMRFLSFLFLWAAMSWPAAAHEIRPALLQLEEQSEAVFEVRWKQPVADGRRLALEPELPQDCEQQGDEIAKVVEGAILRTWRVSCALDSGAISIAGLDNTLTDVFVEIHYLESEIRRAVIRPGEGGMDLSSEHYEGAASTYVRLGVEHILSGPDHLLFVAGLLLLARLRKLVFVITAFTLAHSLTLALTALGWVHLSAAPVELMIAVSILLLAVEAVRVMDGKDSFTAARPWLVSFGFGLLHGFGFAGALAEIGLPQGAEILALFYFNVGVEVGQLLFVGALLALGYVLLKLIGPHLSKVRRALAYAVGISGAFWVVERLENLIFF